LYSVLSGLLQTMPEGATNQSICHNGEPALKPILFVMTLLSLIFSSITPPQTVQAMALSPATRDTGAHFADSGLSFSTLLSEYWNEFTAIVWGGGNPFELHAENSAGGCR
jgi:hypothetical protein